MWASNTTALNLYQNALCSPALDHSLAPVVLDLVSPAGVVYSEPCSASEFVALVVDIATGAAILLLLHRT